MTYVELFAVPDINGGASGYVNELRLVLIGVVDPVFDVGRGGGFGEVRCPRC